MLFLVAVSALMSAILAAGDITQAPSPSSTAIVHESVTKLPSGSGVTSFDLVGYSWRRFSLVVPPKSAIDLVAVLENSKSKDPAVNCGEQLVTVWLDLNQTAVLPEISPKVQNRHWSTDFGQLLAPQSYLCEEIPSFTKSIKNAEHETHWHLMVQTQSLDEKKPIEPSHTCSVKIYYNVASAEHRDMWIVFVMLGSLVCSILCYRYIFIKMDNIVRNAGQTFRFILLGIPYFLYESLAKGMLVTQEKCETCASEMRKRRRSEAAKTEAEAGDDAPDSDDENAIECRICKDGSKKGLISPCNCTGSMAYVHRDCLDQWRVLSRSQGKDCTKCELCTATFNEGISCWNQASFVLKAVGKFLTLFVIFYLLFWVTSWITIGTAGVASCSAPWHKVDIPPVYSLVHPALGCLVYGFFSHFINFSLHMTWADHPLFSDPMDRNKIILGLHVSKYVTLFLALILAMGYFLSTIAYLVSPRVAWSLETSFGMGFLCLLLFALAHRCVLLAIKSHRESRGGAGGGGASTGTSSSLRGRNTSRRGVGGDETDGDNEDDVPMTAVAGGEVV